MPPENIFIKLYEDSLFRYMCLDHDDALRLTTYITLSRPPFYPYICNHYFPNTNLGALIRCNLVNSLRYTVLMDILHKGYERKNKIYLNKTRFDKQMFDYWRHVGYKIKISKVKSINPTLCSHSVKFINVPQS